MFTAFRLVSQINDLWEIIANLNLKNCDWPHLYANRKYRYLSQNNLMLHLVIRTTFHVVYRIKSWRQTQQCCLPAWTKVHVELVLLMLRKIHECLICKSHN